MSRTVLVTGGSGYVASHLVKQLLEQGDTVHTTVRSLGATAKVAPLTALHAAHPGRLKLFKADLLNAGDFRGAMAGCEIVYHVASPFLMPEKITDGQTQMVEPALRGTRNVLDCVNATDSVKRVVLTSTVGAIFGDYIDVMTMKDRILSEAYFNTSSTVETQPYHLSKVLAEKAAWEMCEAQDRWSMVVINPGLVLGPSITPASDSGSLFLLDELMKGYFFYGAPNLSFTVVDVRDVALAHIRAGETPTAAGRYILAESRMYSFLELAHILRPVHRHPIVLPHNRLPDALVRLVGPRFGLTDDFINKHLGVVFEVDNARSIRELGINYRDVVGTVRAHYQSWVQQRLR